MHQALCLRSAAQLVRMARSECGIWKTGNYCMNTVIIRFVVLYMQNTGADIQSLRLTVFE